MEPDDVRQRPEDSAFLAYVRQQNGPNGGLVPDQEDYDQDALRRVSSDKEAAEQYRLAQSRKLLRMWREWKASQN